MNSILKMSLLTLTVLGSFQASAGSVESSASDEKICVETASASLGLTGEVAMNLIGKTDAGLKCTVELSTDTGKNALVVTVNAVDASENLVSGASVVLSAGGTPTPTLNTCNVAQNIEIDFDTKRNYGNHSDSNSILIERDQQGQILSATAHTTTPFGAGQTKCLISQSAQ